MKTAKTEIADPNVINAVVPMDIVVIKDMTMFPSADEVQDKNGGYQR